MEDQQIIELFWQRSEEAIAALDWKYGQALRAFSQHITGSPHDAEECVNDAYLGVWNSIPPKTPQHLPHGIWLRIEKRRHRHSSSAL